MSRGNLTITVARKPIPAGGTVASTALAWGTGGLNIGDCRIAHTSPEDLANHQHMVEALRTRGGVLQGSWANSSDLSGANPVSLAGRWPANVILVHNPGCQEGECEPTCPCRLLDEQSEAGGMHPAGNKQNPKHGVGHGFWVDGGWKPLDRNPDMYGDFGGASRFFKQVRSDTDE